MSLAPIDPTMFFDMDGRMMLRRINSANMLLLGCVIVLSGMFVLLGFVYRASVNQCGCPPLGPSLTNTSR
jgi:hypothetical protein